MTISESNLPACAGLAAVLCLGAGSWLSAHADDDDDQAVGGRVIWEDLFFVPDTGSNAFAVVRKGGRVFAGGTTDFAGDNPGYLLRAYEARNGALLWEEFLEPAGEFGRVWDLAATKRRVIAAGFLSTPATSADWSVRAYDAANGALLWEDLFDRAGGFDTAANVAALGKRVVAGGNVNVPGSSLNWFLRGYDLRSGRLLWQDEIDRGGYDQLSTMAVSGKRIFANGFSESAGGDLDLLLRAYGADGAVLWQEQFDNVGGDDWSFGVAAGHGRVAAASTLATAAVDCLLDLSLPDDCDYLVRVHDAATGAVIWQDQLDVDGRYDAAYFLAIDRRRLFVAGGTKSTDGDMDLLVRAYDVRTGGLLWQDLSDAAGGFDLPFVIKAQGGMVYVGGYSGADASCDYFQVGHCDYALRAYDAETGALRWEDRITSADGSGALNDLDAAGNRVWAAGREPVDLRSSSFIVRSYSAGREDDDDD